MVNSIQGKPAYKGWLFLVAFKLELKKKNIQKTKPNKKKKRTPQKNLTKPNKKQIKKTKPNKTKSQKKTLKKQTNKKNKEDRKKKPTRQS